MSSDSSDPEDLNDFDEAAFTAQHVDEHTGAVTGFKGAQEREADMRRNGSLASAVPLLLKFPFHRYDTAKIAAAVRQEVDVYRKEVRRMLGAEIQSTDCLAAARSASSAGRHLS